MNSDDVFPFILPEINESLDDVHILTGRQLIENDHDENDKLESTIDFFRNLAKNPKYKQKESIQRITKFLKQTSLIETIALALAKEKKQSITALCLSCAKVLKFQELRKGEILFRYHDMGDKCYFIVTGKLSCLKPIEIYKVKMHSEKYLKYLLYIQKANELALLEEIIKLNVKQFPIQSIADLEMLYQLFFIATIKAAIRRERFTIEEMEYIFKKWNRTYEEFKIDDMKLNDLWTLKKQKQFNADEEFDHYLNKKFKMSSVENVFFEKFRYILQETEIKEWTCLQYSADIYFGTGFFFGHSSFEKKEKRRNASIRAETDSIIASLNEKDYMELISVRLQKEKAKKVNFLFDNFFFKSITLTQFEKHYFEKFSPQQFFSQYVLYQSGKDPKEILFLHQGKVAITIKCSVIDLHNLIKFLIDKMASLNCFTQGSVRCPAILSKEKISEFRYYLNDPILNNIKSKSTAFIEDMNKIRNFNLFILSEKEVIGIEEIILQIPYLTSAKVLTGKALFFKLKKEDLNKLLIDENTIVYSYSKLAANKLSSLLERLYHIKQNYVDLAFYKSKQEEIDKEELRKFNETKMGSSESGRGYKSNQFPFKEKVRLVQMKREESKIGNLLMNISQDAPNKKAFNYWNPTNYMNNFHLDKNKVLKVNKNNDTTSTNILINKSNVNPNSKNFSFEVDDNLKKESMNRCKNRLLSMQHKKGNTTVINEGHISSQSNSKKVLKPSKIELSSNEKQAITSIQPFEAFDLARNNSQLNIVDLLGKESQYNRININTYNHLNSNLSDITNLGKYKLSSSIDSDRITYIGNFRKKMHTSRERGKRYNSTQRKKNYHKMKLLKIKHHQKCGNDLISQIVQEYYNKMLPRSSMILGKSSSNSYLDIGTFTTRDNNNNNKANQTYFHNKILVANKSSQNLQDSNS